METDPLGRAILDYRRGGLRGDCLYRDGTETWDGHIYENYFRLQEEWSDSWKSLLDSLDHPVVDIGCGSGQYAEFLQERGEVVAIDLSPAAVEATRDRGVEDARVMDMFEMSFPPNRFRSVLLNGTQLGLSGSLAGARQFLSNLARITDADGVAVVDNYDPTNCGPDDIFGYRPDPRGGVAHRTFHFEYERDGDREVGRTLHFVLFSPERLRDVTVGTPWHVADVRPGESYYKAVLRKGRTEHPEYQGNT